MNKKLKELLAQLEAKQNEARSFINEGDVDKAEAAIAEKRSLEKQIKQVEEMIEDEKRSITNKIEGGQAKKVADPQNPEKRSSEDAESEYRSAFLNMIRGAQLTAEEARSLKAGTAAAGGYTVPKSFQAKLIDKLQLMNVMRQLAKVIQTDSDTDIPVVVSHGTAAWTAEEGAFNESDDAFGIITIRAFKLTRIIKVSEELLQDSAFDLEAYLVNEFARSIAKAEEQAFVVGTGTGQPTGVMTSATIGKTTASATAFTSDEIIDLFYALPAPYRAYAVWLMNDQTIKAIRKLKDSQGNYLWTQGFGGVPDSILGRPVYASEFVDQVATGKKVMAFGDFSYYNIADRKARVFQRLNELYSATGQVGFRGYERVDGILTLAEAVQVMKMA
jgi:HK97 family phage major capsid protein